MNVEVSAIRPGPGWKQLSGAVWEHANGTRIHLLGVVRLSDGTFPSVWSDLKNLNRCIKINGGNRKRGLMAWALCLRHKV